MRVSVFGLGYVGSVSAACLARDGHAVIGVDCNQAKVDLINRGESPIFEHGLAELIAEVVGRNQLRATTSAEEAVLGSDVSLVCVGTPGTPDGSIGLNYVKRVCADIGEALQKKDGFHVVVMRSTMLPGTIKTIVIPLIEMFSGRQAGRDFGVCINPEFLREGTAIRDFDDPPQVVIGASENTVADIVARLYERGSAPVVRTRVEVAEMVKYACNIWHALKVDFANEIGAACNAVGIDGHEVMDIFVQDTRLNISPSYLRPGFAFGGSCLPKDTRALCSFARQKLGLVLPLLEHVLPSNEAHISRSLRAIESRGNRRIGILGVSFKAHTDDLRESPMLKVAYQLMLGGYELKIFDPSVRLEALGGVNLEFATLALPRIREVLTGDVEELLSHGRTIVIGNNDESYKDILRRLEPHHCVVDLVGLERSRRNGNGHRSPQRLEPVAPDRTAQAMAPAQGDSRRGKEARRATRTSRPSLRRDEVSSGS